MPTYGPTNTFATQSGNVQASQLDQNFTDAFTGINNAFLSGLFAARPAPDGVGKGRYYFATDLNGGTLFRDNGAAWVQVASAVTLPGTLTAGTPLVQNPYAVNAIVTQAHGLGINPTMVIAYLECLNPEHNYSVGDRVRIEATLYSDANAGATSGSWFITDTANVVLIQPNAQTTLLPDKTTKVIFNITAANWKLVATPYKLN